MAPVKKSTPVYSYWSCSMKAKTINAVLVKKVDEWIDTLPEPMRARTKQEVIVTGGCIASMLLREKVNDFDIYFTNEAIARKLACYYIDQFKAESGTKHEMHVESEGDRVKIVIPSAGVASMTEQSGYKFFESAPPDEAGTYATEVFGDIEDVYDEAQAKALETETPEYNYQAVFLSTNAITLSGKIQLILRFTGTPEEIHKNYDFVHCTNWWTYKDGVVLNKDALESLMTREIRYVGSKYPLCSVIRLRKFIARGWTVNAGQIFKMCYQIGDLDLSDISVLEDQLTGVDVAYFMEVIHLLRSKDKASSGRVEKAYLLEIIERMF